MPIHKSNKDEIKYSDVRSGSTWRLIPVPKELSLRIEVDLPKDLQKGDCEITIPITYFTKLIRNLKRR